MLSFLSCRRALKRLNREQTATLQTALLQRWRPDSGRVLRAQMRTAQQGSIPIAWLWPCGPTRGWSSLPTAGLTCQCIGGLIYAMQREKFLARSIPTNTMVMAIPCREV